MLILATNNDQAAPPGFRLQRLEVRNWGTFHEKIHILDPAGETALLLGDNGSGKSTLVDALLTLLVPKLKRNYNLSAAGTKKKERDEKTYVLGAYGSESAGEELRAQTKYLRKPGGAPSILLATFKNRATDEAVTLAHVLWVQDDEVRKLFLIARSDRSIYGDFSGLGDSRTWKKTLRSKGFEVEDSFSNYAEKVVRYLRMESTTTLALFSQTVAIKEITHVSGFIRDHMLERLDAKTLVYGLERHYQDLKACWETIRIAKEQLELLAPVVQRATEIGKCDEQIHRTTQLREALPACFAIRLKSVLEAAQETIIGQIREIDSAVERLTKALELLSQREFELRQAIDNDEVGKQLARVQELLQATIQIEANCRAVAAEYQKCLEQLGREGDVTSDVEFTDIRRWAEEEKERQDGVITSSANAKAMAELEVKRINAQYGDLDTELRSLRARPDLIPERDRQMRLFIAKGSGVDAADLPFAGELMNVKDEYQAQWRGALERLLHNFGLSLLIPEHLYSRVNRFINDNNLRGRVAYHRVPASVPGFPPSHDANRVIERMDLKVGHPLSRWVEGELRNQFNYRCCESIEEFERASGFAVTRQGLIRRAGTLHIKDDRSAINDPRNYVLGWSNVDKIQGLEDERNRLAGEGQKQAVIVNTATRRLADSRKRESHASQLLGFRTFAEIDWRSAFARRCDLETQKMQLEKSSDKIKTLQEQLEELLANVERDDRQKTENVGQRGALNARKQDNDRHLAECDRTLSENRNIDLPLFNDDFAELLGGAELTVENASVTRSKTETMVTNRLLQFQADRGKQVEAATRAMGNFLAEFRELKADLTAGEAFISEFIRLEETLRRDDLPRHDQRFQELMSGDVLVHVVKFQDELQDHCDEIRSKIDHLNSALKTIKYSERTYIAIRANLSNDQDIRTFRARLKGCLDYGLSPDGSARDATFERISGLIDMLREKPDWTAKVTDTRNWLTFVVEELDRESGKQENIYEDTSGKSGGQKAKLAFTILASAVAYQYGIARDRNNPQSFRFVVVDEMFSKSDETNSRYALQLFAQFHLQLLIVCPFDARARVVEPFVSNYHLALNPTTESSTVRTISVLEVREHLARQAAAQVANASA